MSLFRKSMLAIADVRRQLHPLGKQYWSSCRSVPTLALFATPPFFCAKNNLRQEHPVSLACVAGQDACGRVYWSRAARKVISEHVESTFDCASPAPSLLIDPLRILKVHVYVRASLWQWPFIADRSVEDTESRVAVSLPHPAKSLHC